ncbi:MAG: DUF1957 domain-containing protein [Bacteroidetes bacterium]|nr:DUF1957 domain-containing protein [Bacteroidota bacterium]
MDGSLVLIFHTHLPYVLRHGKWPHGSDWLCEAAAECYIPILNECRELMEEGIVPNITISLSPVVAEQLADSEFAGIFNDYLDEKIASSIDDRAYFAERRQERHYVPMADFWCQWYRDRQRDFNERYGADLCGAFRRLMEDGAIALQTCGATHGYFPLLGHDRNIDAQIGVAMASHTHRFGAAPRGIWMPECAYRPGGYWQSPVPTDHAQEGMRQGVEQLIAAHGLEYTVVDSHLTRGGKPLGVYAGRFDAVQRMAQEGAILPLDDSRSVYDVYRVASAAEPDAGMMAVFTRDAETTLRVWSGVFGYPGDPDYLEFHKKHHNSGHRYWRVTDSQIDLALKTIYRPEKTAARVAVQAEHFVSIVERALADFRQATGREGVVTAPFDTELFGHWWFEGPRFLGEVLRRFARGSSVRVRTAPDELDARDPGLVIQIPEGSWGEGGGHAVWLNDETAWTWPMIYEVEDRLSALLAVPAGLPEEDRILRQMARELLLLEASDWQFLITTASAAEYARQRLVGHYNNAMRLAGYVDALRRGETLSAGSVEDLAALESDNRLFPNLSLEHFMAHSVSSAGRSERLNV